MVSETSTPPPPPGALAPLSLPGFRTYFIGQTISLVGFWMQFVAQGWVIASLADSKNAENSIVASVQVAASIPMVLLSLYGGVVADRYDRRKILIVTQVLLAVPAFAYAALLSSGALQLGHVYALAVVLGVVASFDLPAMNAFVPQLVPPPLIASAVAINQAMFHGARIVGPALAGLLMAQTSVAAAFIANGASYAAVVVSLLVIRAINPARPSPQGGWRAMREGLVYAWRDPTVRALLGLTALLTVFVFPFLIVFTPLYVKKLGGGEGALGQLMTVTGIGAVTGSAAVLYLRTRRGRSIVVATLCVGGVLIGLSRAGNLGVALPLVASMTVCTSIVMGMSMTLLQITVPDELRGRLMGVQGLMFTGLMPAASVVVGVVADVVGLLNTAAGMGVALLLIGIPWAVKNRIWEMG